MKQTVFAGVLWFAGLLVFTLPAYGQTTYTITGSVLDAQANEGLPGATVQIVGTQSGTATRADGGFDFDVQLVPGSYTLRMSFVGFRTEERDVAFGTETTVNLEPILLEEDVLRSEEVLVTGSGVPTERRRLGNSIGSIGARDLEDLGAQSVDQALTGKLAGALVQQNSGSAAGGISIRLRGTGTVLGSADPLYVVDGVIVDNSSNELLLIGGGSQNRLVDLNPEDIERIEVVKGAAAAALYGSRANNGVVQIFTKRGVSGAPRVTFETGFSASAVRKTLEVNRAEFASPADFAAGDDDLRVERFDYQDDLFRTSGGTEQHLSISGGGGGTTYFVSGGHNYNEGIVTGNDFQRFTGRARVTQSFGDWLQLSAGGSYANSGGADIPNGGLNSNYGALTGFLFGPNSVDASPDPVTGEYPDAFILANPLEVPARYQFDQETNRFTGDVQASLRPTDRFSINYTFGLDTYDQIAKAFIPRGTSAPDLATGFARRAELGRFLVNHDLRARYQAPLSDWLESTTLVGGTLEFSRSGTLAAQGTDIPVGVETISGAALTDAPGSFESEQTVLGAFAQQTFGLYDRLFVTAAGRFDASSSFGSENRWHFYPKVSASYNLSDESFWASGDLANIFSTARLRASYGETGGLTAIGPFARLNNFTSATYNGQPGFTPPAGRGNPDIKPERQRELEFGLDLGFLRGRLGLEATYYNQKTTDLLLNRTLAPTTGFSSALQNVGELSNRGFELLLRATPVATPDATWNVTATFATNRNRVDGIEDEVLQFPDSFGGFTAAVNGEPIGVFYGAQFERERDANGEILENGSILGQETMTNADGNAECDPDGALVPATLDSNGYLIDGSGNSLCGVAAEAGIIGDANPDWTGSLINELSVGRFDVRFQFDASIGNDVLNFTRRLAALSAFGTLVDYQREIEGELPIGYNGSDRAFNIFEHWVEDGSFVKLREVSLAFRVPAQNLPLGIQGLRITAYGRNLLSFDNYSGYDPEINVGGQRTGVRGFDFVETPIPRTFGLILSASL